MKKFKLLKDYQYIYAEQFDGSERMAIRLSNQLGWPLDRRPDAHHPDPLNITWGWILNVRTGDNSWSQARATDWLVKDDFEGTWFVIDDKAFKKRYAESTK